jgi:hypothetical protein
MSNKEKHENRADEKEVYQLLAKANEQYKAYLDICSTISVALPEKQPNAPQFNWDHPLTLTLNKDR